MEDLLRALEDEDHPRALALALVAWRTTRADGLADLIDHVTARCVLPEPPSFKQGGRHKWWVAQATRPDPLMRATLIAMFAEGSGTNDDEPKAVRARWAGRTANALEEHLAAGRVYTTSFQEKLAFALHWDDDPRLTRALLAVVAGSTLPYFYGIPELLELIADLFGRLADRRAGRTLEALASEPRAGNEPARRQQVALAHRALRVLAGQPAPRDPGPLLASCLALVAPPSVAAPPPRIDVEPLWREVAANPDDLGTRMVLGDGLIENGDLRGDVFVLQRNARTPNRPLRGSKRDRYDGRVKTLLRKQWTTWFGDLALALVRRGSEFHCGMLEVARIGVASAPPWVYAKARGHRELVCVHTLRPAWVSPADYATFALALPRFPRTLAVDTPQVFDELAKRGAPFDQLLTLEIVRSPIDYQPTNPRPGWPSAPFASSLERVAELVPTLRELRVFDPRMATELGRVIDRIPELLPQLTRVAVDQPTLQAERELRASRLVEIID